MVEAEAKSSPWRRRSALRSGLLTGLAVVVVAASAAAAGALLAHRFGRNARTDGFLAAYGIYIVFAIAAQSFRFVVVPELTRAVGGGSLPAELRAYAIAFCALAVPVCVIVAVLAGPIGELVTGRLPEVSAVEAGRALVWLVPAGFTQLLAALCAGALAAGGSYGVAAVGYSAGGIVGVAVFAALAGSHGIVTLAWGLAANGTVAVLVPLVALVRRGEWSGGRVPLRLPGRLWRLVDGAAVAVALQGFYVVALRLAAGLGVGKVTSFSYAYLLAGTIVTATAFSLGVISSAPLTRRGLDARRAAEHVVHSSWISLVLVAAAAGVFALVGGPLVSAILGGPYRGVGRLVADLAPWMVTSAVYAVTFPLVFVLGGTRRLVPIALGGLAVEVPVAIGLRDAAGLPGLAGALAIGTLVVIVALLATMSPGLLRPALVGLTRQIVLVGGLAALSFGVLALVLAPILAAAVGLLLFTLLLGALRTHGLQEAWTYVRALH